MDSTRIFGGRYRVEAPLGQGGFGVVHRVRDLLHDRDVALKTVRGLDASGVHGLKREFRALATLSHRNLVQLYDLVVTDEECFFTMELIRGVDVVEWIRGAPPAEREARLRSAFAQLAVALGVLHAHGTLHRDVKPSNVLVEPDGRLVLLDFGFATRVRRAGRRGGDGDVAGSFAYMAPELLWGEGASPASDCYSVGAVLFEALTGALPFDGDEALDLIRRQAPPPRARTGDVPDDLGALAEGLLEPARTRRLGLQAMLERIRPPDEAAPERAPPPGGADDGGFVGRQAELALLASTLTAFRSGRPVSVLVHGPSGIGKTALVTRALAAFEDAADALVLRGRCHPKEAVPFAAVDTVIDELAAVLASSPDRIDALVPPDLDCLAQVFPVIGRIPALRERPAPATATNREPAEIRRRAVEALRELLARLGVERPVVVWVDDLQWGDRDGALFLRELRVAPGRGRVAFVVSFRSEDRNAAPLELLLGRDATPAAESVVDLALGPLQADETRALVAEILRTTPGDPAVLDGIVRAAAGSPFLAGELSREHALQVRAHGTAAAPSPSAPAPFGRRMARLPDAARRMLALVAAAGQPLAESVFHRAARDGDPPHALAVLANECLVRYVPGPGQPEVTTYHDRVREAVLAAVADPDRRALHVDLAEALEAQGAHDPDLLFHHWLSARRGSEAGRYAIAAAERASAALAFNRSAELYRHALALGADALPVWELHARLGDALVNAGMGAQGAAELAAAADARAREGVESLDVLGLRRRAAEHFLRSGRHREGLSALRVVLDALDVGYPKTTAGAVASLVAHRVHLRLRRRRRARATGALSPADRARLEACWSAGLGLGLFDTLRAAHFQARHALLAHQSGDVAHRARALLIEAFLLSWEGGARKRARSERLRAHGDRLALESGDPNVRAFGYVLEGVSDLYLRRLERSLAVCDAGEAFCRDQCIGAAWELSNFRTLRGIDLAYLGELGRLADHQRDALRQAEASGDQYYLVNARLGITNLAWLAPDRPDEARRQADLALAGPFPSTFSWQVYQGAFAHAQIDLYAGDAATALARVAAAWSRLRAQQLLRFQTPRLEMAELRGRAAVMLAAEPGRSRRDRLRLVRRAMRDARRLVGEEVEWPRPFAHAIRAAVQGVRGDEARAGALLERAAAGFDALGMALHAACARWHLAAGAGRAPSHELSAQWMRERGIRDPGAMAAMLVPSPWRRAS